MNIYLYLSLEKICGYDLTPVTIEESKSCAEGGGRDAPENSLCNDTPPARLGLVYSCDFVREGERELWKMSPTFVKEIVKEEGFQLRVFLVSQSDVSQEDALKLKKENKLTLTGIY